MAVPAAQTPLRHCVDAPGYAQAMALLPSQAPPQDEPSVVHAGRGPPEGSGALAVMLKFCASNRAVAVTLAAGLRLQVVEVPLQAPLQLTKVSPCTALAVKVTRLFFAKFADALVQAGPQLIAAGPETMLPWPVPAASFCTVTVTTLPMSSVSAARLLVVSGSL